jgi:ATP-binding cassette, subfamily B, bacterial
MSRSTPTTSNLSFAWQYLKTEKKAFILAVIFVIVNALLQTLTPVAIEYIINNAIKTVNYTLLLQVTAGMCLLFLIEGFIFRYQVITVGYAAQRIMYKIRTNLFAHIQKLKTDFFNRNQSGDLISRINSDTTLLDNFLGQYIFSFTSSFFVFLAFGIYLLILNPILALVAYLGVVFTIIISLALRPIIEKTNQLGLENNGKLKSYLADNLNNYQVIQAYSISSNFAKEFVSYNKANQQANFRSRIFTNIFTPIYNFAGNLALLLILVVVFYFKIGYTEASIGALVAFIFAVIKFFQPLRELGGVFSSMAEAVAALTRVREILNEPINNVFSSTQINLDQDLTQNIVAIEFENVSFAYPGTDQKVFNNISFKVPTNSKFAIIGPTGEGKSTIAKLITGLLSQDSGTIKIFGKELQDWNQADFYDTIGFILQDPFLFSGTVASNIVYGNSMYEKHNLTIVEADQNNKSLAIDSLIAALKEDIKQHELDTIIPNLEEFLATEVNNNSQNISQGQKQIINFIRVLLREPKILILDEATANLDTITEQYLQQALDRLNSRVTQIIIAHRQNTIKDADLIMLVGGQKVNIESKV